MMSKNCFNSSRKDFHKFRSVYDSTAQVLVNLLTIEYYNRLDLIILTLISH